MSGVLSAGAVEVYDELRLKGKKMFGRMIFCAKS